MQVLLFLLSFGLFIGLVLIHEWGHFMTARRHGVKVEEFGLGLPPRAKGRRLKSGMLLSLNWLPLGGFVKLKGEHDADRAPGSFGAATTVAKAKILLAGVAMNLLAGLIIITILALTALPTIITPQTIGEDQFTVKSDTKIIRQNVLVGYIEPGSPASKLGLRSSDIIQQVKGPAGSFEIKNVQQLHDATQALAGQTVQVTYKRGSQQFSKAARLRSAAEVKPTINTDNPKGYLGVAPNQLETRRSSWSAPVVAVGLTVQLFKLTFLGLWHAIQGLGSAIAGLATGNHAARENGQTAATSQVGGPVAIVAVMWSGGTLGLSFTLLIVAIISLTLALMNALPIPALDGGRLFVILLSRLARTRFSPKTEEFIHGAGMVTLLIIFCLITIVDIHRFL